MAESSQKRKSSFQEGEPESDSLTPEEEQAETDNKEGDTEKEADQEASEGIDYEEETLEEGGKKKKKSFKCVPIEEYEKSQMDGTKVCGDEDEEEEGDEEEGADEDPNANKIDLEEADRAARYYKIQAEMEKLAKLKREEFEREEIALVPLRQYLMSHVIPTLTKGLIEITRVRPTDPVEYLAEYLFQHNPAGINFANAENFQQMQKKQMAIKAVCCVPPPPPPAANENSIDGQDEKTEN